MSPLLYFPFLVGAGILTIIVFIGFIIHKVFDLDEEDTFQLMIAIFLATGVSWGLGAVFLLFSGWKP